jgi:hypothetical protein
MARKLIFIDDSGCTGFKFGRGSTDYFGIAAVFFDDDLDAEETALKIKRLRRSLGWHDLHEFKFRKTSKELIKLFFNTVQPCNFRVVTALIDKRTVTDIEMIKNPRLFYYNVILHTIRAGGSLDKVNIYIDGEAGRKYSQKVKTYIRQNLPKNAVNKVTFKDSNTDSLVQLADMIVGALLHTTEERGDSDLYYSIIKEHIETSIITI